MREGGRREGGRGESPSHMNPAVGGRGRRMSGGRSLGEGRSDVTSIDVLLKG